MNFPFLPERASTIANQVDAIFLVLTALAVFFTGIVFVLLVFFGIRYRAGNRVDRSNAKDHSLVLELSWSIIPLLMGLVVFVWAAIPYTQEFKPQPGALQIWVIGKRWMWHLQHENGVRENNELHIPLGKTIQVTMISQDVIHGFYIPAFRIKRDVLPGRYNTMQFTTTATGKFHLFCTEFCGMGHSEMTGWVYVMEPKDYARWLAGRGEQLVRENLTGAQRGEDIYTKMACGNCHDKDGLGRGPILAGIYGTRVKKRDGTTTIADVSYLRDSILNPSDEIAAGYQQIMPSYKGQLTEEQVIDVIAYIKSLSYASTGAKQGTAPVPPNTPNKGKAAGSPSVTSQNQNTAPPATTPNTIPEHSTTGP